MGLNTCDGPDFVPHSARMNGRFAEAKSEGILKHFVVAFVLALLCYVFSYGCDRHLRLRKGPWELTFKSDAEGVPVLVINQTAIGITNVVIRIEGKTMGQSPETIEFTGPGDSVPFGEILFFDTTYLPGTLTLELFGHEVEMMPRTLVLNFEEHPWVSGEEIVLTPEARWREVAGGNQETETP